MEDMQSDNFNLLSTEMVFYQFNVPSTKYDVKALVETTGGEVVIYAKIGSVPSKTSYDSKSYNINNRGELTVLSTDFISGQNVYFGVLAATGSPLFTITTLLGT